MKLQRYRKRTGKKRHQWTLKQNSLYLKYLQDHFAQFLTYQTRKQAKVFLNLAKMMKTRKATQTKSHHQKLMTRHGSLETIIAFLKQEQEVFAEEHTNRQQLSSELSEDIEDSQFFKEIEPKDLGEPQEKVEQKKGLTPMTDLEQKQGLKSVKNDIFCVLYDHESISENQSSKNFFLV